MSYTIKRFDKSTLVASVADNTIDSSTLPINLIGKNRSGYGEAQNHNFVYLLENFAGATQPSASLSGQIWYNSAEKKLAYYDGVEYRTIGRLETTTLAPTVKTTGDLWFDGTQLKIWNGSKFLVVGPSTSDPNTLIETVIIKDINGLDHTVLITKVNGEVVGAISNDTFEVGDPVYNGYFDIVSQGFTLSSSGENGITQSNKFWGTATDSDKLGTILASEYLKFDVDNKVTLRTAGLIIPDNLVITGNTAVPEITSKKSSLIFKVSDTLPALELRSTSIKIPTDGTSQAPADQGTIRYNGTNFQGYTNSGWITFSSGNTYSLTSSGNAIQLNSGSAGSVTLTAGTGIVLTPGSNSITISSNVTPGTTYSLGTQQSSGSGIVTLTGGTAVTFAGGGNVSVTSDSSGIVTITGSGGNGGTTYGLSVTSLVAGTAKINLVSGGTNPSLDVTAKDQYSNINFTVNGNTIQAEVPKVINTLSNILPSVTNVNVIPITSSSSSNPLGIHITNSANGVLAVNSAGVALFSDQGIGFGAGADGGPDKAITFRVNSIQKAGVSSTGLKVYGNTTSQELFFFPADSDQNNPTNVIRSTVTGTKATDGLKITSNGSIGYYTGNKTVGVHEFYLDSDLSSVLTIYRDIGEINGSLVRATNLKVDGTFIEGTSDIRLKNVIGNISNPLEKIGQLNGFIFTFNELAKSYNFTDSQLQAGVSAQDLQAVLPEVVKPAPFDTNTDGTSKSGENYLTVQYDKIIPLLIEGIKEQTKIIENQMKIIEDLKSRIEALESKLA